MKTTWLILAAALLASGCSRKIVPAMSGMPGMGTPGTVRPLVTAVASEQNLVRELRLVGRVVPAESAVRAVVARVDGYVEHLDADFTGRQVRAGDALLELYSPALVAAQEELILASRLRASLGPAASDEAQRNADSLVAAARRRFTLWDIGAEQLDDIERTGQVRRALTLRAPSSGTVLEKYAVEGQSVTAGAPLFRIADLSSVWLEADVFENDLATVHVGEQAMVDFGAFPGEPIRATVSYVYPTIDSIARTARVRFVLDAAGGRLRPGMFGTAVIHAELGRRAVVIPRQAALVTGDRELVFVVDSAGRPHPRPVMLGAGTDSLVEVLHGVAAGERVVAAAAFLLDAESNLSGAMAGMAGMDKGPAQKAPVPLPATTPGRRH
jgi:Cu(I)/Ag(I) efflux system membrane fusion protein